MPSDPFAELLARTSDIRFAPTESNLELLQQGTAQLISASRDRQRLREALQALEDRTVAGKEAAPDAPSAFGAAALHALEALTRALLAHDDAPQSPLPADTQRLSAAVRGKRHAMEVLRVLAAQGDSRPATLMRETGLSDMQMHRVLTWALSNGLLLRWAAESNVHYRLSALGETVLEAIDEPQWVSMAATLVRIGVRWQMLARDGDAWDLEGAQAPLVQEAVMLTGLSPEQAARSLAEFSHALQPAAQSNLAATLRYTPHLAGHEILISPPVFPSPWDPPREAPPRGPALSRLVRSWSPRLDSLAESLVVRGVEQAGIPSHVLREVLPHTYLRATKYTLPYFLPRDRPIISIGSPDVNPVTTGLFYEYGVSVYLRKPQMPWQELGADPGAGPAVVWRQGASAVEYTPHTSDDIGLLLRIYDEETGTTHFVLGGLLPSGTYAACRYFHRQAEELLEQFPQQSFATVLKVPRSYGRRRTREVIAHPQPVETSANRDVRLDMRYVEVLPLVGEVLAGGGRQVHGPLQQALKVTGTPKDRLHRARALAAGGLDESAPICRRVRDTAGAFSLMGRFEELVELVVHEILARRRGRVQDWTAMDLVREAGLSKFAAEAVARLLGRCGGHEHGRPASPRALAPA